MCLTVGPVVTGAAGFVMSQSWPSLWQAPAALLMAGKTVMSWQPRTDPYGWPSITGCAITLAFSGAFSGTSTIEILLCGAWQFGPELPGADEM